jgi:hypothetical protein
MTLPWVDVSKIMIGPISPEQRRAIDKFLKMSLAQHRRLWLGAVTAPAPVQGRHRRKCSPEHVARLRAYNAARAAARARKLEAANVAHEVEARFLESRAA